MLFRRTAELIVGQSGGQGISIKDLRFSFSIEKSASETLNNSTIKIYNLNPTNRALVETPNNALILKAGYVDDVGALTIFVGIARRVLTQKDGADWITEIEMDDGLLAYRDSKHTASFSPGVSAISVLKFVADQFNLPVRPFPVGIVDKQYPNGYPFVGHTRNSMTEVCNYLGLEWSIQNQQIQVLIQGGTTKRTAVLISADTGMVGSPSLEAKTMSLAMAAKRGITINSAGVITRLPKAFGTGKERLQVQGYRVKSLLNPTIEPGNVMQLKARGIDDFFRIEKVTFTGDTHSTDWFCESTLRFI
jgi:hypothetical protein